MGAPNTETSALRKYWTDFNPDVELGGPIVGAVYAAGNLTANAADVLGGIIYSAETTNSTPTLTLDTANNFANIICPVARDNPPAGTSFQFTFINTGSSNCTVTLTAGTGWTLVGLATVAAASSGTWRLVWTGSNQSNAAFTAYRM